MLAEGWREAVASGRPGSLHCRADHRQPGKRVMPAAEGSRLAESPERCPPKPPSGLLARLLPLDDLRPRDLVVQGLALVVPQRPQAVEQEDDEVRTADERHELERREEAAAQCRHEVEGTLHVGLADADPER